MSTRFPRNALVLVWFAVSVGLMADGNAATLTLEKAKNLVAEADSEAVLQIKGVSAVDPEACAVLVAHKPGVDLSVLKAIDEPLARALAGCEGRLLLNGVGRLSDPCATILATCPGELALSGLAELRSVSLAKKLASQASPVILPNVTALPLAVADALGSAKMVPVLDNLQVLESRLLASRLASREEGDLAFPVLKTLSAEAAAGLAQFPCDLRLPTLTNLDASVAKALAAHQGVLVMENIKAIQPEAFAALLGNRGTIGLSGLETLGKQPPAEVLQAIRTHQGMLGLDGLQDLSPAVAEAMRDHQGAITLTGLRRIEVDIAEKLVGNKGDLWIDNITVAPPYLEIKSLLKHRGPGRIILPEELHALPKEIVQAVRRNPFLCLGNTLGCGM